MLRLHFVSFRNQSCLLNSCGRIISFLINRAFLPLLKAQHWKKNPSLILLIATYILGFGELASPPRENSREPSLVPGSGCWLSFSSVSTAARLPPTPIPSCKLISFFFSCQLQRKKAIASVAPMLKSLGRAGILWDRRVITVHRYKRIIKLMWEWFLQFAHSEAEGTSLSLHLFWKHRGLFVFSRSLILPDFKWTFSCPGDERLILHRLVLWVVTQVCGKHPSVLPNLTLPHIFVAAFLAWVWARPCFSFCKAEEAQTGGQEAQ